ncbi:hypothetical protein LFM09_14080 [Lentzea alba]|uniref:hypothetical protein n=1 Tax=Lentzea alba TaxID=2714351 RepID=UPI0039BF9239
MDEQKLADLFRDAAHDAPPASFDAGDVRTASRRATLRRRNSIAAGTTLVVVLGFGGVVAGVNWTSQEKNVTNSAGAGQEKDNTAQSPLSAPIVPEQQAKPPTQQDFPGDASTQGDASTPGSIGPSADGRAVQGCAAVDRKLAVALAGELSVSPDHAVVPEASCSPPSRAAMFKIDGQTITAIVTPDAFEAPAGAAKVRTTSGQDLYVFTQGDGEFKSRVQEFANDMAAQF